MKENTRESGMSLIELMVALMVGAVVLSILVLIFSNGLTAQRRASERNAATELLNSATASVTESIRASVDTRVTESGQRLDAKVLDSDGTTWECRAWQIQGGQLVFSAGASAQPAVSSTWKSLAPGVAGNLTAGASFVKTGSQVSVGLTLTRGEAIVRVTDGAVSLVVQSGGPSCW